MRELGDRRVASAGWGFACASWVAATLAGCSPHSVVDDPAPPLQLPETYGDEVAEPPGETTAAAAKAGHDRWWLDFADPALTQLVDAAFEGNFDLQAAWARVAQAKAGADMASSGFWPQVNGDLGAAQVRQVGPQTRFTGSRINSASASLSAAYEVDIFRRIGSASEAADLDHLAARDAVQSLAMTLASEVAEAWYDLVVARARRDVLNAQLEVNQTFADLIGVRFENGQASAVELNQQRQLVLSNRSALAQQTAVLRVLQHRIASLTGRLPSALRAPERALLPKLPPLPATGVPSDLLQRRPDLRAAQRAVEAADHRVASAVADRYPRLSLSASISSEPSDFNDLLLDPIWRLAANLALPIIDGGRRAAEVDRTRAVVAEAVANYGRVTLGALLEVRNALVQERQQRSSLAELDQQLQVSTVTLEQARRRYGHGLADFLTVLTALRSQQDVELRVLDAKRQLLSFRIQLCRALGGTWASELPTPALLEPGEATSEKETSS